MPFARNTPRIWGVRPHDASLYIVPSRSCIGALFVTTGVCQNAACGSSVSTYGYATPLQLPLSTGAKQTLTAALVQTLAEDMLEDSPCHRCKCLCRTTKTRLEWWPRVLCLTVRLWRSGALGKIIVKDARHSGFGELVQPAVEASRCDALRAVIEHLHADTKGECGHIVAWCRFNEDTWYRCNDAHSGDASWHRVEQAGAYRLFHEIVGESAMQSRALMAYQFAPPVVHLF